MCGFYWATLYIRKSHTLPLYCKDRGRKDAGGGVHFSSLIYGITEGLMSRLQSVQNAGAALASGSTSGGFQDGHPGLPVTVRHGSSLSGRRLSVGLRRRSAAFCHIKDVRCETNIQQLWRQVFSSCRSEAVEQPSS